MAPPDVNSMPPTRTSRAASNSNTSATSEQVNVGTRDSRRTSSVMVPPPVPTNSSLPNSPRPSNASVIESSTSQGPLRHPRPLTAAELHLELEKEQESIVNRLTRELSALRAQTASVASTTSSTSDLFTTPNLPDPYSYGTSTGTGASIIPTSARRHRSSSNLSTRSARSARDGLQNTTTSVSAVAAPREQTSARQSFDTQRPETSRQNSYGLGLSTNTTGGNMYRSASNTTSPYAPPQGISQRSSASALHSRDSSAQNPPLGLGIEGRSPSFSSAHAAARYEEAAVQRQELDAVKKENEALKQRIRDLERQLSSGSTDTTAVAAP